MTSATYRQICGIAQRTRVHRLLRGGGPYLGLVLMFHRVTEAAQIEGKPHTGPLWVTTRKIEESIRYFRGCGYEIASLDRMADVLGGGHADRPLVVYTFDDGYRDNFELAYPVFKRHEAPFAIYVASGLPDGGGLGWPFALEELVNTRATVDTNIGGLNRRSSLTTEPERTSAYDLIREAILASVSANGDKQVDSFFKTNAIGLKDYSRSISMSWEQIKELACEPLATLGSHTANHYMLSRLPPADALREVEDGKARLETETGKRVRHFAYPYGCKPVSDNLAATMGERLGFATCVTTRSGFLCPDHADHLASLPRFQVSEDTPLDSLHIGFKRLVDLVRGRKKDFVVG